MYSASVKKKCVGCGKMIPGVALDCVFCSARQPVDAPAGAPSVAAEAAGEELARTAESEEPSPSKPDEGSHSNIPSRTKLTGMMPAVMMPDDDSKELSLSSEMVAEPEPEPAPHAATPVATHPPIARAAPRQVAQAAGAAPAGRPYDRLSRVLMGAAGSVLLLLFFLPWHGVSSWRLLEVLDGGEFIHQLFYLTGGATLLLTALLPVPFTFRAVVGAGVAALPVLLGAGNILAGWRGLVAGIAILALPATNLCRAQVKNSGLARLLVAGAVLAIAGLYLIPESRVMPLGMVFQMMGAGEVTSFLMGLFTLIPLGFAALSLLGLLGRDLTDVGVLLAVLSLLWAPLLVGARGLVLDDSTQVYGAVALLVASATAALSLAQILSLAARSSTSPA